MALSLVSTPADADTTPVIQVEVTLPVKNAPATPHGAVQLAGEPACADALVQKQLPPRAAKGAQLIDAARLQQVYNTKMFLIQRLLDAQQCRDTQITKYKDKIAQTVQSANANFQQTRDVNLPLDLEAFLSQIPLSKTNLQGYFQQQFVNEQLISQSQYE